MTTPTIRESLRAVLEEEFSHLNELEQQAFLRIGEAQIETALRRAQTEHAKIMRALVLLERTLKGMVQSIESSQDAA